MTEPVRDVTLDGLRRLYAAARDYVRVYVEVSGGDPAWPVMAAILAAVGEISIAEACAAIDREIAARDRE